MVGVVDLPDRGVIIQNLKAPFPDLILLDLLLSGMDGKTICRQLKGQETTRHIPIILMSANKNTPRIAREVGADDWIMKPFEMWALLALLDAYMGVDSRGLARGM
jgi:DNA-binding response OmpR family regulator